jgi:hypothetical protein
MPALVLKELIGQDLPLSPSREYSIRCFLDCKGDCRCSCSKQEISILRVAFAVLFMELKNSFV